MTSASPFPNLPDVPSFELTSRSFQDGETLHPAQRSGRLHAGGADESPQLSWSGALPRRTLTVPAVWFAVTRSRSPSWSRSSSAENFGLSPVANVEAAPNAPEPLPTRTVTVSLPAFVTTRSVFASPSTSARAAACGSMPAG